MAMKEDPPKGMAQIMGEVFRDVGDDFLILNDLETGCGQVIVKNKEAMDALCMGIEKLRQRKASKGSYRA